MGENPRRWLTRRRGAGVEGPHRALRVKYGRRPHTTATAPDLVERQFTASEPNRLWVADITYLRSWEGFLYLAVVIEACSRKVVGWAMADHLRTELVLGAVGTAIITGEAGPGPDPPHRPRVAVRGLRVRPDLAYLGHPGLDGPGGFGR